MKWRNTLAVCTFRRVCLRMHCYVERRFTATLSWPLLSYVCRAAVAVQEVHATLSKHSVLRLQEASRYSRQRLTSAVLVQLYNSNGTMLKMLTLAVLSSHHTAIRRLAGAVKLAIHGLHHLTTWGTNRSTVHAVPHQSKLPSTQPLLQVNTHCWQTGITTAIQLKDASHST